MNITSRSYLTAGVAALSAGAIALTPVQPIPDHLAMAPQRVVSNLSVDLAAAIDPITPWVTAINAAVDNAYALQDTWNARPFPIIQTIVQNQFTYLSELPNIGLIFQQITGNIGNFLRAPFATGADNVNDTPIPGASPNFLNQRFLYNALTGLAPDLEPVLSLLTSPASGFLLGFAGPGLSSILQLQETVQNIFAPPPGAKPLLNAINEILNLPANLFNAAFNGGKFLDLTDLVKNLVGPTLAPAITSAGVRTGGFLNAGGVAFDGLATEANLGLSIVDPGLSVGFIGATGTLANSVADAIKVVPPAPTASVAAAAATPAVEAAAPEVEAPAVAEVSAPVEKAAPAPAEEAAPAPAEEAAPVADEAPAPKRKSRASTRGDNDGGKGNPARAGRAARNAN
jgi:hypothetical protein